MHWIHDRLTYKELLERYVKGLHPMALHCFLAAWNFHQYLVCKNNLEKGQIVVVHDYAQNYLCAHQHEDTSNALGPCTGHDPSIFHIL